MRELSATKRALFETLLEKAGLKPLDADRIPRRNDDGDVGLSFAQQGVWLDSQLMPDNAFYNMLGDVYLEGELNVEVLARSINELISRHEILRTTFPMKEGRPVQAIAPSLSIELPVRDLRHIPFAEQEAVAHRLALDEAHQPFDLQRGPLLRVGLLRLADREYIFLVTIHHLITDAWSSEIFVRELVALYETLAAGQLPSLPDLPIQYADFSVWQRQEPQRKVFETQLPYWRQQLRAPLPVLQLPGRRSQPETETFQAKRYELIIPGPLTRDLKDLAQSEGVSLFMLLLAGFNTLLYRYTGQNDIMVGTGIANRTRPEIEGLIGFFANKLVLRADVKGTDRFRDLLRQVKQVCLAAYAHHDVPFELLVDELRPGRSSRHKPLFQVAMALQNAPPTLEFSGIKLRPYEVATDYAIFDLFLLIIEGASDLRAYLSYDTSVFEEGVLKLMLHHFKNVLEEVVAQPEKKLLDISLLDERERSFSMRQSVDLEVYESEQFGFTS